MAIEPESRETEIYPKKTSRMIILEKIFLCIVTISGIIIFGRVGLELIYVGFKGVLFGYTSKNWPTVEGVIVRSEVMEPGKIFGAGYSADIRYKYNVNNNIYIGKTIGFAKKGTQYNASEIDEASYISNQLPCGDIVNVYYNPLFPFISVLESGFNWISIILFIFGVVSICLVYIIVMQVNQIF